QRSGNSEAAAHLTNAINLIATLPAGRDRDRRELSLQVALGLAIRAIKGQASGGHRMMGFDPMVKSRVLSCGPPFRADFKIVCARTSECNRSSVFARPCGLGAQHVGAGSVCARIPGAGRGFDYKSGLAGSERRSRDDGRVCPEFWLDIERSLAVRSEVGR